MNEDTCTVVDILKALAPDLDMEAFLTQVGGRSWYLVRPCKRDMAAIKDQIRLDPCRDYKVIRERYRVSTRTIYEVWNEVSRRISTDLMTVE